MTIMRRPFSRPIITAAAERRWPSAIQTTIRRRISLLSPLVRYLLFIFVSSLGLLLLGVAYARTHRYSLFRPVWYVDGSQLEDETIKDRLAKEYLASVRGPVFGIHHHAQAPGDGLCIVLPSANRSTEYVFRSLASLVFSVKASSSSRRMMNVRATVLATGENLLCERLGQFVSKDVGLTCVTRDDAVKVLDDGVSNDDGDKETSTRLYEAVRATSLANPEDQHNWLKRERLDYALALDWCTRPSSSSPSSPSRYVLVLQDDGIMSGDGIQRVKEGLEELNETHPEWKVLRLYSSDFWDGWEKSDIPGLIGSAFIGGILTVLVFHFRFFLSSTSTTTRRTEGDDEEKKRPVSSYYCRLLLLRLLLCNPHLWFFLFGFGWTLLGLLIVGKQHLPIVGTRTTGGIVPVPMVEPGTVAYVYPYSTAKWLIQRLLVMNLAEPLAVDNFINQQMRDGDGFEVLPNVVDHVGFTSSSEAKRTWRRLFATYVNRLYPHHVRSGSFHFSEGSPFA